MSPSSKIELAKRLPTPASEDLELCASRAGPSGRSDASMAYDAGRKRIVLFGGGDSNGYFNDTWEWDGASWKQVSPATAPTPRVDAAISYDSARGRVLLIGGSSFDLPVLNDVWEYDGTGWRQLAAPTSPPAFSEATLTYDAARGRHVLFGGMDAAEAVLDTTWLFSYRPAALPVRSVSAPAAVVRGQTGVRVTAKLVDAAERGASITSRGLRFVDAAGADAGSSYSVTGAAANATSLSGGATAVLTFAVDVGAQATTGKTSIHATAGGIDSGSAAATSDATADLPASWNVLAPATLFVSEAVLSAGAIVPGGAPITATVSLSNTGSS